MSWANFAPKDEALPFLPTILCGDAMLPWFRSLISQGNTATSEYRLKDCRVRRVKYKPGRRCLVWYQLDLLDSQTELPHRLWYVGCAFPPGEAQSRYIKAQQGAWVEPEIGAAIEFIEPLQMLLWSFPNERKLRDIPTLIDANYFRIDTFPKLLAGQFDATAELANCHVSVISYAPEYTCNVAVDLELRLRASEQSRRVKIYGKTFYDQRGEGIFAAMSQIEQTIRECGLPIKTPRPLAYDPQKRTLWQEHVTGVPAMAGIATNATLLQQTALALTGFHQLKVETAFQRNGDLWLERLQRIPQICDQLGMTCRDQVRAVCEVLLQTQHLLLDCPQVLLHGDLHAKNILFDCDNEGDDKASVAFIDLDMVGNGPALLDLGSWIAAELYALLRLGFDHDRACRRISHAIAVYRRNFPQPPSERQIAWSIAAALIIERLYRTISRLKPEREIHIASIVSLAAKFAGANDSRMMNLA